MKRFINTMIGRDWDRLRWFLAAHYKFNKRSESRFWQEVREKCDVSGIQEALDLFRTSGPLSLLPRSMRTSLNELAGIYFYGLHGLDCILLGQKVPHPKLDREPSNVWRARRQAAVDFTRKALPQEEALKAVREHPEWLDRLVNNPQGWVAKMAAFL
jgi:tryptophan halogenase